WQARARADGRRGEGERVGGAILHCNKTEKERERERERETNGALLLGRPDGRTDGPKEKRQNNQQDK
ncbi:MAG: hypothetical protein K7J15_05610, partial [Candidatus Regiella insecticola]|nr:hypothetical protein [Candidatus Regiella insecticola]